MHGIASWKGNKDSHRKYWKGLLYKEKQVKKLCKPTNPVQNVEVIREKPSSEKYTAESAE